MERAMTTLATSASTSNPIWNEILERTVLGTVLLYQPDLGETELSTTDFYDENHRRIWADIKARAAAGKPYDMASLEGFDPISLAHLLEHAVIPASLSHYSEQLRTLSFRRNLHHVGLRLADLAIKASGESKAKLLDTTLSLVHKLEEDQEVKGELSGRDLVELFEENQRKRVLGEKLGLSTGFPDLDDITGGFRGGQMIIVAGRPKMGKTIMACNLTLAALEQGKAVLFASFELRGDELADRFISMLSGVPLDKLESGYVDEATTAAKEKLWHDRLVVVAQRSFEIHEFKARTRQLQRRLANKGHELGLVVVDLLTNLKAPSRERRELEVAMVSRELKILAQELNVPVVAVSQLNRSVESRVTPRPRISDLRESGSLEQDADKVILMYRPEYYLAQKPESELKDGERETLAKVRGKCEINVAIQRQGDSGIIGLQFDGQCARLRSLAKGANAVMKAFGAEIME